MRTPRRLRGAARAGSRRGGFALVLSLVLVTVVTGLCVGFVQLAASTAGAQTGSVDQMRAFYLAEAGLAEAFHAVRMGRTGAIGTEENQASYGDGLLHVESVMTGDGQVLLRSTARVGGGEATLGLIVEPEAPPLGFFAEEDLVIEAALMVDGFDSTERSYDAEVQVVQALGSHDDVPEVTSFRYREDPSSPHYQAQQVANEFVAIFGPENLNQILTQQLDVTEGVLDIGFTRWVIWNQPFEYLALLTEAQQSTFHNSLIILHQALEAGALVSDGASDPAALWSTGGSLEVTEEAAVMEEGQLLAAEPSTTQATSEEVSGEPGSETPDTLLNDPLQLSYHTEKGAVLGSNGDVSFVGPEASQSRIFGSVVPGVDGAVTGLVEGAVSGSTEPRALPAELAAVQLPVVGESVDIVHGGAIPHVIAPGVDSIGALSVAGGSEVVIRGPAKLVVADLVLDGGSLLTLDTRDGDVELYITGSLDMDPASFVETTGVQSDEVSILATAPDASTAAPELEFDATSRFCGTIYAPDSRVHIGANFEIFGAVAARRLEIAQGARLHFDDESYNGVMALPEQKSWQILELPPPTRRPPRGMGAAAAPVNLPLAAAHALDDVTLSIRYIALNGTEQRYSGPESEFDWTQVASVDAVERAPQMAVVGAQGAGAAGADSTGPATTPVPTGTGVDALDAGSLSASAVAGDGGVTATATAADGTASAMSATEPEPSADWSSAESAQTTREALLQLAADWFNAQDWEEPGFEQIGG